MAQGVYHAVAISFRISDQPRALCSIEAARYLCLWYDLSLTSLPSIRTSLDPSHDRTARGARTRGSYPGGGLIASLGDDPPSSPR